jgi:SAM-dependent methyltransferase
MIGGKLLTEKEFYDFVLKKYKASQYESIGPEDLRFAEGTGYSHVCKTRCFMVYREIVRRLPEYSKVLDLGFFPGTLIRELKHLLKDKILCYGAGKNIDKQFASFMQPYIGDSVDVELDPFYSKTEDEIKIPFEDETFNAIILTEVIEHLISPLETIAEGARILKKEGLFIITTQNVSHIGAVLKIISGKSNYERLDRSPMYLQNDPWRGHIRYYDKNELKTLFQRKGLQLIYHKYYRERGWDHAIIAFTDKIAPIYGENHFAIFQKT